MKSKRRLASLAASGLAVASAATLMGGGAASAANLGQLYVDPVSGNADSYPAFQTADGVKCPAAASTVNVKMTGPSIADDGNNLLVGTTSIALATSGNRQRAVAGSTPKDIFQAYGIVSPNGTYTITMTCSDSSGFDDLGTFTASVPFTADGTTFGANYAFAAPASPTSTSLAGPSTSTYGDSVTFTATVTSGVPGTVQFKDGGTDLGGAQTVAGGQATYTTSTLGAGSHSITAVFSPTSSSYAPSTSGASAITVAKKASSVAVTTNGPTAAFAPATFTATVGDSLPGSVQFKVDGSNAGGPQTVSGGSASYSTSTLPQGTHTVSAVFTPSSSNYDASTAADVDHVVTAFAGASTAETITATVDAGGLTISVDGDSVVDLGTAALTPEGDVLTASGAMDPVKIIDTRAGDAGWTASAVSSDFSNGSKTVNAYNLGWAPSAPTLSAHQQGSFLPGAAVVAGKQPTAGTTPSDPAVGLGAARVLGQAPAGHGTGTALLGAVLTLNIPTDVTAGTYGGTLTFTVL